MDTVVDARPVVGIDLHRRRTVLVSMQADGTVLGKPVRITNDPARLVTQVKQAGEHPRVVLEATYGWYWAADALAAAGAEVHLAHPLGVRMFTLRRVKNDVRDARDLADLLRLGRLPEAWVAPPAVRELRELVRYRHKLVDTRSGFKAQIHAVLAKHGIGVQVSDLFAAGGQRFLAALALDRPYRTRVDSLLRLIAALSAEILLLDHEIADTLQHEPAYTEIQRIPGVGPILAAVFLAEIGDVRRFARPEQLCSWAGLTPRHRESDASVHRGPITKQGSAILRWAAIEAAQRLPADCVLSATRARLEQRRGKPGRNIGKVAAARKLLTWVYYAMRDGHIRALDAPADLGQ